MEANSQTFPWLDELIKPGWLASAGPFVTLPDKCCLMLHGKTGVEVKAMTKKAITSVLLVLIVFLSLQLDFLNQRRLQAELPDSTVTQLALLAPLSCMNFSSQS